MATPGTPPEARGMTALHNGAVVIAIVSGSYALVALLVGPPLQFGLALAMCGACWIAADFIEWTAERERAARRRAVPAAPLQPGYGSCHAVFVGAGKHSPRPAPRTGTGLGCCSALESFSFGPGGR